MIRLFNSKYYFIEVMIYIIDLTHIIIPLLLNFQFVLDIYIILNLNKISYY